MNGSKRTFVKLECSPVRDGEFLLVVVGVLRQGRGVGTAAVLRGRPRGRRGLRAAVGHAALTQYQSLFSTRLTRHQIYCLGLI